MVIPMDPQYVVLGIPNDLDIQRYKFLFSNLGLVVAKRDIARLSGSKGCPTLEEWRRGMGLYMAAEKVTYKSQGCLRKFTNVWEYWIDYYDLVQVGTAPHSLGWVKRAHFVSRCEL